MAFEALGDRMSECADGVVFGEVEVLEVIHVLDVDRPKEGRISRAKLVVVPGVEVPAVIR